MNDYSLTVIIPNYNKEKYLRKCIGSVLEQSLQPEEIIVVDDLSTDNSRVILKQLEEKYPSVRGIYLAQNGGVSNARNTGLMNARTEYVTFLDSDDYYYNRDKLKNEMSVIQSYAEKGEDVISYSAVVRVSNEGDIVYLPNLEKDRFLNGKIFYRLLAERMGGREPRDYCVRRALLLDVGAYSYPKNYFEDLDLLIRLSQKVRFIFSKSYGTAYRDTPGGLSKRSSVEFYETIRSIRNTYINDLPFSGRCLLVWERSLKIVDDICFAVKSRTHRKGKGA